MPALAVAVARDLHAEARRSASVRRRRCCFSLKDFRLLAVLPIVAALGLALAPSSVTARYLSMFDLKDPTIRDRVAMMREGAHMIRGASLARRRSEHGRDALRRVSRSRTPSRGSIPHLHNVPLQIAAERGLPALAVWLWFVGIVDARSVARCSAPTARGSWPRPRSRRSAAMLAAGMFEYNFGDSEFLMMLLLADHAAVRRRPHGWPPTRRHDHRAARRRAAPATSSRACAATTSWSSATSCSTASSSAT